MIQINQLNASELLVSHELISAAVAGEIVKNRPPSGYRNLQELQSRNPNFPDIWEGLESLLDFQPDTVAITLNSIARKYGSSTNRAPIQRVESTSQPTPVIVDGAAVLSQITQSYGAKGDKSRR